MFSVAKSRLHEIKNSVLAKEPMDRFKDKSTLTLVQSISTLPDAFPKAMNTCGRVCVHPSGRFVVVSNRGHESITIFRVRQNGSNRGKLNLIGCFHTRGETPRHFQFDASGQYLIVANQDSDCISVFSFNLSTGEMKYTGNTYHVPSPNFVCCVPLDDRQAISTSDKNPQEFTPPTTLTESGADKLKEAFNHHINKEISANLINVTRELSSLTTATEAKDDSSEDTDFGCMDKPSLMSELEAAKREILELKKALSRFSSSG